MDKMSGLNAISLSEQRRELYSELLGISRKQVSVDLKEGLIDQTFSSFQELTQEWNETTLRIESLNQYLQAKSIVLTEDTIIQDMTNEIVRNVDIVQQSLLQSSEDMQLGLREVKNQHKVMNAYYQLGNKDQIALYFDQKK